MMIHEITKQVGRHKRRKRIGRGPASGHGKTSGRGHKGARSRSGWNGSQPPGYEGGQMPYFRRIPKRGFSNARYATRYNVVNVRALESRFGEGEQVDFDRLKKAGLISHKNMGVKILGQGALNRNLTVSAEKFSKSAREKIEKAGGSCRVVGRES